MANKRTLLTHEVGEGSPNLNWKNESFANLLAEMIEHERKGNFVELRL